MIKSMTGFGRASGIIAGSVYSVEIKSLNSKGLELNSRLPLSLRDRDMELRQLVSKEAERGKVDIIINVEQGADDVKNVFNKDVITAYINEIKQIESETGIGPSDYLRIIFSTPNLINSNGNTTDDETWKSVEQLLKQAIKEFQLFREKEGKDVEEDFIERINSIERCAKEVEQYETERLETLKTRLRQSLADNIDEVKIDLNRFEQELIYYIEKLDISEEKHRLKNHCTFFIENLKSKDTNGKKLGFILQEIGREINTLGAKANHASIQRLVVEMKDELEKMKEQIANVL